MTKHRGNDLFLSDLFKEQKQITIHIPPSLLSNSMKKWIVLCVAWAFSHVDVNDC